MTTLYFHSCDSGDVLPERCQCVGRAITVCDMVLVRKRIVAEQYQYNMFTLLYYMVECNNLEHSFKLCRESYINYLLTILQHLT